MFKKLVSSVFCVFGLAALGVTSAYAALPAIVGTTLTTLQSDGLDMIDLVWPVVVTIFGGFLLIKVFKRAASNI